MSNNWENTFISESLQSYVTGWMKKFAMAQDNIRGSLWKNKIHYWHFENILHDYSIESLDCSIALRRLWIYYASDFAQLIRVNTLIVMILILVVAFV